MSLEESACFQRQMRLSGHYLENDRDSQYSIVDLAGRCEFFWRAPLTRLIGQWRDRPFADQAADHDAIAVAPANRDLADADGLRPGHADTLDLPGPVLRVNALTVCQSSLSTLATSSTDDCRQRRPMCQAKRWVVEQVVGQEVEALGLHLAAGSAIDATELQPDSGIAAGQAAYSSRFAVVSTRL